MKSKLITRKIDELIALAEVEHEPNVMIVLLSLSGACLSDSDGELAVHIQKFTKEFLLPKIKAEQELENAFKN